MAAAPQRGVASYAAGFPVWALAWAPQVRRASSRDERVR
jgi:hypothetical protein